MIRINLKGYIYLGIFLTALMVAVFIIGGIRNNYIDKHGIYTVAKVTSIEYVKKGRTTHEYIARYDYYVNGIKYSYLTGIHLSDSIKVGNCYKLKYVPEDHPNNMRFYPDSVRSCINFGK